MCKIWPPVESILQTNRGQYVTRVTANCCIIWLAKLAVQLGLAARSSVDVDTASSRALDCDRPWLAS